jgi:hypothetical protein
VIEGVSNVDFFASITAASIGLCFLDYQYYDLFEPMQLATACRHYPTVPVRLAGKQVV